MIFSLEQLEFPRGLDDLTGDWRRASATVPAALDEDHERQSPPRP
jgi:hypothetical protein